MKAKTIRRNSYAYKSIIAQAKNYVFYGTNICRSGESLTHEEFLNELTLTHQLKQLENSNGFYYCISFNSGSRITFVI